MAFEWKVWVLFAVLRICLAREALWLNAANETVTVNGTVEQSSSEVYTLTVPVSNADQPPAVLLTVTTDAVSLRPLIVTVQQDRGVTSLQLPQTRNGYQFQYHSQVLCPFLNTVMNDTQGNVTTVTITVSTSSSINISYTLLAEVMRDFYLQQGETLEVPVNPGGTAIFYYQFLSGDPLEQVLFQLSDESASRGVCAIIHVQDSTCPSEVGDGTLNLQGEYQTMLGLGGILQQRTTSGRIYLGITVVPDAAIDNSSICSTTLSSDLLASFSSVAQKGDNTDAGRIISDEDFFRKIITLRVKPGLTVTDYASAMAGMAAVFLLFYVLALIVISRRAKELVVAVFTGRLCGNNVDVIDDDEEDGVELAGVIDNGDNGELDPVIENKNIDAEVGVEETDGLFKSKQPASNEPEAIEMAEFPRQSDPKGETFHSQSLPRSLEAGVSFGPVIESTQKSYTITRDTRPWGRGASIKRQRMSVSESSQGQRRQTIRCKPSVMDILSGRYEDARLRADSGSRRGTGTSSGGDSLRHESVSSAQNSIRRAQTFSSSSISRTADQPRRPQVKNAYSAISPTETQPPYNGGEVLGAQHGSHPNVASQDDIAMQHPTSLPLQPRSCTFSGDSRPTLIGILSGRYEDAGRPADSGSLPSERPQSPAEIAVPHTPLESIPEGIKEEDTLPRKPKFKSPLSRIASVEEGEASEALIGSHSSESSHGSENGTPTQGHHQPPTTAPPPSSVGTPNTIIDQRQPELQASVGVTVPSPLLGRGEEEGEQERSSSAQPLTESLEVEVFTSTLMPGGQPEDDRAAHKLRVDECNGDFLIDPNLAEMNFPEGKDAQRQSNRFVWQLIGISLFYLLPAYQLVIAYQKFLDISGNQDLCFYNHLCSWPILIVRSVNNIWSNCGYVALGFLLFFAVHRAKYNYRRHEENINEKKGDNNKEKEGVPQYFGIYFALSYVLIAQGFTSAAYHICPNQATFQFDTAFMYIMAGLACLRIFQSRHPDRIFSASFAFITFAIILAIAVVGTLHADLYFYIVWFILYQVTVMFILLEYYYRWRLTSVQAVRIKLCRAPSRPVNVPKFVFVVLCLPLNIGIGAAGVWYQGDFGSHMLVVFISNFAFYMIYYIVVKMIRHEWPPVLMVIYFVIAFMFWIPAIYFFLAPVTDWSKTPSLSREGNRACIFWNFYDEHDLWHFLSAFALFFSMLAIMNFDSNQRHWRRDGLKVF